MRASTGHFSGVSVSNLTDTPALIQDRIYEASAEELLTLGAGMKLEERAGKQMALIQKGFFMELEVELPDGEYSFSVQAGAPNRGSDSYWVQVDGKQVERPLALSVGSVSERSIMLRVRESGKHKIRMELECVTPLRDNVVKSMKRRCMVALAGAYPSSRITTGLPIYQWR